MPKGKAARPKIHFSIILLTHDPSCIIVRFEMTKIHITIYSSFKFDNLGKDKNWPNAKGWCIVFTNTNMALIHEGARSYDANS